MITQPVAALSFNTIVDRVVDRLIRFTLTDKNKVRVVHAPTEELSEYLAQPGLLVQIPPPEPEPMSGAGRYAYLTTRRINVWIVTRSLNDPGGRSEQAVIKHIDTEEAVQAALCLEPHGETPIAKTFKWLPGGQDMARKAKTNPGLTVSVFPFAVLYVPLLPVNRSDA